MLSVDAGGTVNFMEYTNSYDFNVTTTATLSAGSCYQIDAERSAGTATIFIDATPAASAGATMGALASLPVAVGVDYRNEQAGYGGPDYSFFDGRIADVAVYDSGLSAAQIASHYQAAG